MKTLDEVIDAMERCSKPHYFDCNGCPYEDAEAETGCHPDDRDADVLHYLKEYRVVTDICHKHGIASVWGQVLPDPEKTDWDKKLNFDNAYDNDPLDWETLKTMEGKPVWVEWATPRKHYREWFLLDVQGEGTIVFRAVNGDSLYLSECDLGKTWQAYRKERS